MNLRTLQAVAALWVPVLGVLVAVAAVGDAGEGWTVAGPVIVGGIGLASLAAIFWLRQRPIAPGDDTAYRTTLLSRLALVETAGLIGFALAIAVGPWWLVVVGAVPSLVGLWWSWPSPADRERHELLYLI